jgi:hypothetical protein
MLAAAVLADILVRVVLVALLLLLELVAQAVLVAAAGHILVITLVFACKSQVAEEAGVQEFWVKAQVVLVGQLAMASDVADVAVVLAHPVAKVIGLLLVVAVVVFMAAVAAEV